SWDGFKWICYDDNLQNIVSFRRIAKDGSEVVCVVNFAPVKREDYRIGVEKDAFYLEVLNSDEERFGGSGVKNIGWISAEKEPKHGYKYSIPITVPPLACVFFTTRKKPVRRKKDAAEETAKTAVKAAEKTAEKGSEARKSGIVDRKGIVKK
ncbi:MAG: alpha amylase C-terminal domain-containing protein, partial [Lachnospiraceae bacterium]|nr:alpha amylase C-terminal domain-containing protein [Lachnospiraceae bacterium]